MLNWRNYLAGLSGPAVSLVGPGFKPESQKFPDPAIFVDGGANFRSGQTGFSVGDGDSFSGALDLRLPQDKDFSDLAFVLESLPAKIQELNLFGFLGGRWDHQIFNLGELHRFLKSRPQTGQIRMDSEVRGFARGSWQVEIQGCFSLLLIERGQLCLHGKAQYTIQDPKEFLPLSSLGLSNIGSGLVGFHATEPFFVIQNPPIQPS